VIAAVLVLGTAAVTLVREVVTVVGAVVGAGAAVATTAEAGWSGAFVAYRFPLA
jgi:uncharacterized protein (DUF697 family)